MSFAEIKKAINSNLNIPLDELVKSGAIPVVKSVQRGVTGTGSQSFTINISAINPSKSIIIVETSPLALNGPYAANSFANGRIISSTQIQVLLNSGSYSAIWQVIEFY